MSLQRGLPLLFSLCSVSGGEGGLLESSGAQVWVLAKACARLGCSLWGALGGHGHVFCWAGKCSCVLHFRSLPLFVFTRWRSSLEPRSSHTRDFRELELKSDEGSSCSSLGSRILPAVCQRLPKPPRPQRTNRECRCRPMHLSLVRTLLLCAPPIPLPLYS